MQRVTTLTPIQPYRFDLNLKLVSRFTYPVTDQAHPDQSYWRALRASDGTMSLWRVTASEQGNLDVWLVQQSGEADVAASVQTLSYILGIDDNPHPFFEYAQTQPKLWAMVEPLQGMRWLKTPTVYDALIGVIIEQHISWVSAQRYQQALVQWAGNIIYHEGRAYYAYPTPEQLAGASFDDLSEVKVTTRRKALMLELSQEIASGKLDIEALRQMPIDDAYRSLMGMKGIGHWSAAFIAARGLGSYAFIPDGDVALQAAANEYFNHAKGKLTAAQTRALYERFGEFGGAAAFYTLMRRVVDKYSERV
jgi:3-methyladenine DNA glycosylase/8-oxoguanine DNA glycosylase